MTGHSMKEVVAWRGNRKITMPLCLAGGYRRIPETQVGSQDTGLSSAHIPRSGRYWRPPSPCRERQSDRDRAFTPALGVDEDGPLLLLRVPRHTQVRPVHRLQCHIPHILLRGWPCKAPDDSVSGSPHNGLCRDPFIHPGSPSLRDCRTSGADQVRNVQVRLNSHEPSRIGSVAGASSGTVLATDGRGQSTRVSRPERVTVVHRGRRAAALARAVPCARSGLGACRCDDNHGHTRWRDRSGGHGRGLTPKCCAANPPSSAGRDRGRAGRAPLPEAMGQQAPRPRSQGASGKVHRRLQDRGSNGDDR